MHELIDRPSYEARRANRRARVSLVMACGLHSALLVAMWRNHIVLTPADRDESAEDVVDLDLASEVPPPIPQAEEVPVEPSRVLPEPTPARESSATPRPQSKGGGGDGTPNVEPAPPAPSGSASGGWTFSPTARGPVDLGLGTPGVTGKLPPGAIPKVDAPADERPSVGAELAAVFDQGRGSPVKAAVEMAARGSEAPENGKAVFDVTVGVEGGVQISLVSATTNYEGWNELIATIRKHLAKKNVRIPPNAKGFHVVVEVEAHDQLPDGKSVGSSGFGENRSGAFTLPSVENIGVRPMRIVSSRITRENRL
ncbi:hypothetical protein LVJ94_01210 [Pendulispora rubella]|uniref:Uncharacterized protein n=1 Tax=Pendulispora rubella TaxID=2741070 RepID=A0ABZ2L7T8_9BACT